MVLTFRSALLIENSILKERWCSMRGAVGVPWEAEYRPEAEIVVVVLKQSIR
jgi:hypothetical protein